MKKFLIAGLALTAALSFTGCDLIIDILETAANGTSSQDITQTATESKTWNYSATNNIYEIGPEVASVTIKNYSAAKGKTIYLVHANKSDTEIPAGNLRTVQATSSVAATPVRAAAADDALEIPEFEYKYRHFVPSVDVSSIEKVTGAARAASRTTLTAATPVSRTVGTTKYIFVDSNSAMNQYTKKAATLRAVGNHCNVWIVDQYYTSGTASGNKASTAIAQEFATKFDEIYPYITNVFGSESDKLVTTSGSFIDMETYSDTGDIINIVLYDIGVDYSQNQSGGVLGYFYAKDYYYTGGQTYSGSNTILNYTNQGKYFYVDSAFAVSAFDTVLSTLAHEFQHMVNFGQKNIAHKKAPDTWYNEMLSMLCEDMMQEKLDIDDADSPKGRLQQFNAYYYASGLNEWLDDNAVLSYSVAYAFGGWLCRQYGGAALVKAIMDNEYVDDESIVAAVNSKNGTSYKWDDLFEQFLLCITGSSTYTMNQDAAQTLEYSGYKYPMTAIDLWDSTWGLKGTSVEKEYKGSEVIYENYDFLGPILLSYGAGITLRPAYGFLLHGLGVVSSGSTKTITFNSTGSQNLTMYLIIQ
ncbi:MAG: hypothetical protein IJJ70_01935 [Treponema sp.]|nr:hypothetical protein [Treponema sp.]MBR0486452.1 hypothetical protein [Treponema sp.]